MSTVKSKAQAQRMAGKVSERNSKMPGSTYATDPFACVVGSKLAGVEGSTCHRCYARKLAKLRPTVGKGWANNQAAIQTQDRAAWVAGVVFQITLAAAKSGEPYHRWFDAGDLDSVETLDRIAEVAARTPEIHHWLPTREAQIVKEWIAQGGQRPGNLVIRISSTMIGDGPRNAMNTSTVHRKGEAYWGYQCPAPDQGGNCGACRACWSTDVANVSYRLH